MVSTDIGVCEFAYPMNGGWPLACTGWAELAGVAAGASGARFGGYSVTQQNPNCTNMIKDLPETNVQNQLLVGGR